MATVIDGSASVTINNGAVLGITSGTAVASTSGTSIDFTGLPSWVKRITVMFSAFSTNGSSVPIVQLGTSGGIQATSYTGSTWQANTNNVNHSTGFIISVVHSAPYVIEGVLIYNLLNSSTGLWVGSYAAGLSNTPTSFVGGGSKTLSGTLDRIRITTTNGTDTFDAGSINILYEG